MASKEIKVGIVLSYLTTGFSILIAAIFTPIMLRILGQQEYGLYSLVSSFVAYFGVLNFGLSAAYIKYFSRYRAAQQNDSIAKLNGVYFFIFSLIAIITLVIGGILSLNVSLVFGDKLTLAEHDSAKILLMILSLNMSLSFISVLFDAYIAANQKFIFQKSLAFIKTFLSPFVTIPILLLGFGSIGMVISTSALYFLFLIINILFCFKKIGLKINFKKLDTTLIKDLLFFSFFIFIDIIIDQINWNSDKYILGRIYGTASVATYSISTQLNFYFITLATTIATFFTPKVHEIVNGNNSTLALSNLMISIGRIQFFILAGVVIGFCFFGKDFIFLWAGPEYQDSYYISLLIFISSTISLIQEINTEILRAQNKHKFRSFVLLLVAFLKIGLSIPLSIMFGGIGAAIGTALCLILGKGIIMNIYYSKVIRLDIKRFWRNILMSIPSLLLPAAFAFGFIYFFDTKKTILLFLGIVIFLAIYFISLWFFSFNTTEKAIFKTLYHKVFKNSK